MINPFPYSYFMKHLEPSFYFMLQRFSQLISTLIVRATSNIRLIISGKYTYIMNLALYNFMFLF